MDFISNLFNTFGTIPTLIAFAIIALLFYSIIKGGKGNGGGQGNGTGGGRGNMSGGAGSAPRPPQSSGTPPTGGV